jgi:putative MATE family efflux protein
MDNQRQNVLDDSRIGWLLLKLTLPAFFGMFVITLYNVVDTIFVGHYVGYLGIAGLSIVFPIQMLSMGIGMMTGIGGASLISRLIGAGNRDRAEHALGNAITSTVGLSAIIMIVGLANPDFWLRLFGASETILPYARDYVTIILFGIVFQTVAMALNSLIRAEGNARVPMTGMIIGAVLNIIFCAIFIIPLHMGVKGSALAAVLGQLVSAVYLMSYYFRGKGFLRIHLRNLAPELNILRDILAIGIASLAMTLAGSLSAVFVNRVLVLYGGDYAVSTFGIVNRMMMFAIMPGMTIGQGLQPILGFNYGAKRYDMALKAIKLAMAAAIACGFIAFIALYFAPEPFIRVFTTDDQLIALGSYAAKRLFLTMALVGFAMVGSLVFQSIGKVTQSFITAISRSFLFLIPLIFILPHFWQLDGVWWAFPITDALTFILTLMLLIPQIRELSKEDILTKGAVIEV